MYDNDMSFNMGSYDADIAWTFDFAQADNMDFSFNNMLTPSVGEGSDSSYGDAQFQQNPYHQLDHKKRPRGVESNIEAIEGEEDIPNDWPDKVSRPGSPRQRLPHRRHISPNFWHSVADEALRHGSHLKPISAVMWNEAGIDHAVRQAQIAALHISPSVDGNGTTINDTAFPPPPVLDYFVQLYFEHLHPRFPVIHLPTFDVHKTSSVLLAIMALAGSTHSKANRGRFTSMFYNHARKAILSQHESDSNYVSPTYITNRRSLRFTNSFDLLTIFSHFFYSVSQEPGLVLSIHTNLLKAEAVVC